MKCRIQPLCLAVLSAALCMSACGKTEEAPESEPVETEAAATEDIPEEGKETVSEEEQVRMVYEEGLKMTFCI